MKSMKYSDLNYSIVDPLFTVCGRLIISSFVYSLDYRLAVLGCLGQTTYEPSTMMKKAYTIKQE